MNSRNLIPFLEQAKRNKLIKSINGTLFYLKDFFKGIELENKRVLDVGCGVGLFSIYAYCCGAKLVVGLEPEQEGSMNNAYRQFKELKDKFHATEIAVLPRTLQSSMLEVGYYDIIVLHDSINHLDEEACIKLREENEAFEKYKRIFSQLYKYSSRSGKLIIGDCSYRNLFPDVGLKNPFCPSIEWNKHQSPKEWAKLACDCGYINPYIDWTIPSQLRYFGKIVGNKFVSYFLSSHFRLIVEK